MINKSLCVFTPTYNRADMLPRLYESLTRQSCCDFEWLIVDDGSSDGSENLIKGWIAEIKQKGEHSMAAGTGGAADAAHMDGRADGITIRYFKQKNGGKMRAHNLGVRLCHSPLFVCLDSDDYFTDSAVSDILEKWSAVKFHSDCAGIVAHKGESTSNTLYGAAFPDNTDFTSLSGLYRSGFRGETTLVFKTEVLRAYPFPHIQAERYVPEDFVYDRIDRHYRLAVLPKILTVCSLLDEGYTDSVERLRRENPTGWYLYYLNRARFEPWSLLKLKYISHLRRFKTLADKSVTKRHRLSPILSLFGIPGEAALRLKGKL